MSFQGFSPEAFGFLRRLKRNNHRDWFQPRKEEYQELIYQPMADLITTLSEKYGREMPELNLDPKKAIYRIHRDVRFSNDKSPYKTHIAASFAWKTGSKSDGETPGVYIVIGPDEVGIAGGLYQPSSRTLRKIRESLVQDRENYLGIVEGPSFKRTFGPIQGARLKTAPQGIDPEHPMIEHLRLKQFYVWKEFDPKVATQARFAKTLGEHAIKTMPFIRWLNKAKSLW